ncbi:hypothetical protein EN812_34665, partial [Mesorhizobium sp. M4B.F.Ca.ET.169.01.1.1]
AIPITVADRVTALRAPLQRHQERLWQQSTRLLVLQFGGAAGTLEKLGDKGPAVRAALAARLGLGDAPQWQSQRDALAELDRRRTMQDAEELPERRIVHLV